MVIEIVKHVDQWANLHTDLLNEIVKHVYSYDDYLSLREVCKQWNLGLPKIPSHERNPWLVLPFNEETSDTLHLRGKEIYHLRLPEMQNSLIRGCPDGGLLMVIRHLISIPNCNERGDQECHRTYKFHMYKLNYDANEAIWSRVYGLGNYVLMLGLNSSVWMSPHNFTVDKGNHIYYTDDNLEMHFLQIVGGHDVGILNLEDGITNQLFPRSDRLCPPPVWLLPQTKV